MPTAPEPGLRYLFYLHGRIVEDQGLNATSPEYGRYEYQSIVTQFADSGFAVVSEPRAPNTDPELYADSVASQVRRLVAAGVSPNRVAVVGASKGAVIAMLVSTRLTLPVRYVLLANCNRFIEDRFRPVLHGAVLSIYERTDSMGGSCQSLFARAPASTEHREIELNTGLGHGFLYRPLPAWVGPAIRWSRGGL